MVTDGSGKQYGPLKMTGDDWWIDQDGTYLQFHSPATIQRIETLRPLTRCPSPAPHYNDE